MQGGIRTLCEKKESTFSTKDFLWKQKCQLHQYLLLHDGRSVAQALECQVHQARGHLRPGRVHKLPDLLQQVHCTGSRTLRAAHPFFLSTI